MPAAEKMSITVTPAMAKHINQQVKSGQFASASEVVREAYRVWKDQKDEREQRLAAIRARLERSFADPHPGYTAEEVLQHIREHSRAKSSS